MLYQVVNIGKIRVTDSLGLVALAIPVVLKPQVTVAYYV